MIVVRRNGVPQRRVQLGLHSKPWPRGAAGAARSLVGTDQQESEFCTLHKSWLSSGQSDCIWDQPTVLHETVSPHLCLAVFPGPAVNKAGWGLSASAPARGETSPSDLAPGPPRARTSGFQLPDSPSSARPASHKAKPLWHDRLRVSFQRHTLDSYTFWHGPSRA